MNFLHRCAAPAVGPVTDHPDVSLPPEPLPDYDGAMPAPDYGVNCEPVPIQLAFVANYLGKLAAHPAGDDCPKVKGLKHTLREELRKAENTGWKVDAGGALFGSPEWQEITDSFRNAAKLAKKIADEYARRTKSRRYQQYRLFARLFTELKRFHLSHNAPDLMREGAERELEFLIPSEARARFRNNVSGSQLSTAKSVSMESGPSAGLAAAKVTIRGGIMGETRKTILIDDDRDVNLMKLRTGGMRAVVSASLGPLKGTAEGTLSATCGAFVETADILSALQIDLNNRANATVRDSLNPLTRSAAPAAQKRYRNWRKAANAVGKLFGLSGHDPKAPLYLHDRKILKGAFSHSELCAIAGEIDTLNALENRLTRLEAVIERAYTPVPDFLQREFAKRPASDSDPMLPRNVIADSIPLSAPSAISDEHRARADSIPWKQQTLELKGKGGMGFNSASVPWVVPGANIGFSVSEQHRGLRLERLKPTHEFLDPSYTKDIRTSRELLDRIKLSLGPMHPQRYLAYGERTAEQLHATPLDSLKERITSLYSKYIDFLRHAHRAAFPITRHEREALGSAAARERATALEAINRLVWNNRYDSAAAQRNPEEYIGRSYDAFSLALGELGLELAEAKQAASLLTGLTIEGKEAVIQAGKEADRAYRNAKSVLDANFLPLRKEHLLRHATIQSPAASTKTPLSGSLNVDATLSLRPTAGTPVNALERDFFRIEGVGSASRSFVKRHPNPVRRGTFLEFTITCGATGTADAMRKALVKLLDKCVGGGALSKPDAEHVLAAFTRAVITEAHLASTLLVKFRKPPADESGQPCSWRLQYVRTLKSLKEGFSVKASNVLPPLISPIVLGGSLTSNQTTTVPQSEEMGNDLGYHILQYGDLKKLILGPETQAAASPTTDYTEAFLAEPALIRKYFSRDGILQIVSDFLEFAQSGAGSANEFRRFQKDKFRRLLETIGPAEHFAPGSGKDIFSPVPGNSVDALKMWFEEQRFDIRALQKGFTSCHTPQDRMRVLCAKRGGDGASIFDAYVKILDIYENLMNAAKATAGYEECIRPFALQVPLAPART